MLNRFSAVLLAFAAFACMQVPSLAATGTLTLTVHPHTGAQSLDISGTAPAGEAVDLVLYAAVSADLPILRLNHVVAQAGPDGKYVMTVGVAPNYIAGSVITVEATTPEGASAVAKTILQPPGSPYIDTMDGIPDTSPY